MATVMKKTDPKERIRIGDVLMISPETQKVTKAFRDRQGINERLVIGVCTDSNNYSQTPLYLYGGDAKTEHKMLAFADSTRGGIIRLHGGDSHERAKNVVTIESTGRQLVNIASLAELGDRLTISRYRGKAEAIDILNNNSFSRRSIGTVAKFTNSKKQVLCKLDIE